MSGQCRELGKLEAWSREGSGAPLPEALRRHASACATCGGFLAEVEQLRSAFAELGADPIPDERLGAIRFSVMAGARRSRARSRTCRWGEESWVGPPARPIAEEGLSEERRNPCCPGKARPFRSSNVRPAVGFLGSA